MEELSPKNYILPVIEYAKNNYLLIELMITEQCNFYCKHCMYDSGPDKSSDYMGDKILSKVKKQVDLLESLKIPACVNLVGGEPTLNFDKFEYIFKEVSRWNCSLIMSTNSWWIQSDKFTKRFFDIVKEKVGSLEKYEGNNRAKDNKFIAIRLSEDPYHDSQRRIKNLEGRLSDVLFKLNLPKITKDFRWIRTEYQDVRELGQKVIIFPNGRGQNVSTLKEFLNKNNLPEKFCFCDNAFSSVHYLPSGEIADGCGHGSIYNFGTVDDNILFIMAIILKYKEERFQNAEIYNCYNCRKMVQKWKMDRLENVRTEFSMFNTMNYEEFMKELNNDK
jgi:hypothetical protein